uniref:Pc07, similar to pallidipin n=1 Tax=Panstrongylus chinai TaxID=156444 RepID=A0A286T683_9HEMI|nr:Pc07, similar to pallidipin [Panstrongylus chinai]
MKMIIPVTFLGILMHAFAEECQLRPPMENFDSSRYFKVRHFYVTHSKFEPRENVCGEFNFVKVEPNKIETLVTENYNIGGKEHNVTYNCIDTTTNENPGRVSTECDITGRSDTTKFILQTSLIATDYENYVFFHTCFSDGKEEYLVLQASKDRIDDVKDVAEGMGLSLDSWFSRKNVNCDNIQK